MAKTALVVDDSRVALLSLSRLLKPHGLQVETAESGPEALDYLRMNPPPVAVFLDHMMPGMDGFETLAEIKKDQRTAAIPVVMYTSHDGEAYLDEARALGASAILRKPAQLDDVERVLATLNLAPADYIEQSTVVSLPMRPAAAVGGAPISAAADIAVTAAARQVASQPRMAPRALPRVAPLPITEEVETPDGGRWIWIALVILVAGAALWAYQLYRGADAAREQVLVENGRLKAALNYQTELATRAIARADALASADPTRAPVLAPAETVGRSAPEPSRALLNALAWALNQHGRYDFGEIPLNDERLRLLRELLARLNEAGFRGTVRLDSHVGEFCLTRDEQGFYRLPPSGTPFSRCEVVRYLPMDAVGLGQRQTDNFARFVAQRALANSAINVSVISHGTSRPLHRFPEGVVPTTAAEWNAIARLNQRIEVSLIPKAR